jgi:hypothetical protein
MCDEKTVEYLRDLIAEKQVIEEHVNGSQASTRHEIATNIQSNYQGDNESNKNTTETNPTTSSNTTNGGATKSIAQRLLDQGKLSIFQNCGAVF